MCGLIVFSRVVAVPALTPIVQSALANNGYTCSSFNNQHDTLFHIADVNDYSTTGVYADIEVRSPGVCVLTGNEPFSTSYVMLEGIYSGTVKIGYAQAGWENHSWGCDCLRFYWEYTKDGTPTNLHRAIWGTPSNLEVDNFKTSWYSHVYPYYIHMSVNGDEHCNAENPPVCGVTTWNPQNQWDEIWSEFSGEVDFPTYSQFPGTSSDHENFTNVQHKDSNGNWGTEYWYQNGQWVNNYSHPSTCNWASFDKGDGHTNFDIWTNDQSLPHSLSSCP